ncbi:MAG TPA: hypothetical protein VGB83_07745 [Actinomycetota bacterium]
MIAAVAALALLVSPAHARQQTAKATLSAPVPCASALCAFFFWPEDQADQIAADPEGYAGADPLSHVEDPKAPCRHRGMPETYDEVELKAPSWARLVIIKVVPAPDDDWDAFLCKHTASGDTYVGHSFNPPGESENISAKVQGNKRYVLIGYNYLALADGKATITWHD